jgi:hypothetical protein
MSRPLRIRYTDAWYHIRELPKFTVSSGVERINREVRKNKKIKKHVEDLRVTLAITQE